MEKLRSAVANEGYGVGTVNSAMVSVGSSIQGMELEQCAM